MNNKAWNKWFAWYPIRLTIVKPGNISSNTGKLKWLCFVKRMRWYKAWCDGEIDYTDYHWEYIKCLKK